MHATLPINTYDSHSSHPTSTLYLSNLPWSYTESDLSAVFHSLGESNSSVRGGLEGFSLPRDISGRSKGYAFIACKTPQIANGWCTLLDGKILGERTIRCSFSQKKKKSVLAESFCLMEEEEQGECEEKEDNSASSTGMASTPSIGLTKSAKRRLKRQRAIAAAETNTQISMKEEDVDQTDEPERKKQNRGTEERTMESTASNLVRPTLSATSSNASMDPGQPNFDSALQSLLSTLQEGVASIPPIEKYFATTHSIPHEPLSDAHSAASSADGSNPSNSEHACMKKVRFFVRNAVRVWKQVEEIPIAHECVFRSQLKQPSFQPSLATLSSGVFSTFHFLVVISSHLLVQHLELLSLGVRQKQQSDRATSSSSGPAKWTDEDAQLLSRSITNKDSPLRLCRRTIEHIAGGMARARLDSVSSDPQTAFLLALQVGQDFAREQMIYEHLLFQSSRLVDRIARGENGLDLTLSMSPLPPHVDGQLKFPLSLEPQFASGAESQLGQCLVSDATQCHQLQQMCLNGLNSVDEKSFQQTLKTMPTNPSIHARLQFLRSILNIVRSTLQLGPSQAALQPYGSFLTGTANNESDLDVQLVLSRAVYRSNASNPQEFTRRILTQLRNILSRKGLLLESGQLNARFPVLKIRQSQTHRSSNGATSSSSSNSSFFAPCDCDLSVIHEEEFINEEWYAALTPTNGASPYHTTNIALSPNVIKSLYLSRFLFANDQVRRAFVLVRRWFTQRQLNNAASNTLSTFSWTLMFIHAMQRAEPPQLPQLPVQVICTPPTSSSSPPPSTICELIHWFFHFHGHMRPDDSVVDIRAESSSNRIHGGRVPSLSSVPLVLVDPIEPNENPARSIQTEQQARRLKRECRRASWMMDEVNKTSSVEPAVLENICAAVNLSIPGVTVATMSQLHLLFG